MSKSDENAVTDPDDDDMIDNTEESSIEEPDDSGRDPDKELSKLMNSRKAYPMKKKHVLSGFDVTEETCWSRRRQ